MIKNREMLTSAKKYFRDISYSLILCAGLLIIFCQKIVEPSLYYFSAMLLIIAMSVSTFGKYYFGIVNALQLNADQKGYIQLFTEIIAVVLNLIISIILIINGFSIQVVKLSSSFIYLIRPVLLNMYVKRHYDVRIDLDLTEEPIKQKRNGSTYCLFCK